MRRFNQALWHSLREAVLMFDTPDRILEQLSTREDSFKEFKELRFGNRSFMSPNTTGEGATCSANPDQTVLGAPQMGVDSCRDRHSDFEGLIS